MSFNWEIYRELNPDLARAGLHTKPQVESHYRIYGIREKRRIHVHQTYPGFNPSVYRNKYPDLKNLNDIQVSLHWLRYGIKNGRTYTQVINKPKYTRHFSYDKTVRNNKVLYSLIFKNNLNLIINTNRINVHNNEFRYNNVLMPNITIQSKNKILIRKNGDTCVITMNNVIIGTIDNISKIYVENNNNYKLNMVFPVSLMKQGNETMVNFDYIINKYINYVKQNNFQLTICHTETNNFAIIDKLILDHDINYIFVANPLNFNLGYCRNLYKYVNLSNNILYNDVDMPLELSQINKMLAKMDTFDVVKPYVNNLYQLNYLDKYKYINKSGGINLASYKRYRKYSITGGILMIKNSILVETGGYEEFNSYGYEDRCFDVVVLAKRYKIFFFDDVVYHLHHEKNNASNIMKSYIELSKKYTICNYGCGIRDGIMSMHDQCVHKHNNINVLINRNKLHNANINLFKQAYRTINLKP
jgi:hypothetical protein